MPRTQRLPEPSSAPKRTNTREDKRRRFLMHIERRMAEIKKELDMLENMAGPNYEYTAAEAVAICDTLDEWVATIRTEFGRPERPKLRDFKLGNQE